LVSPAEVADVDLLRDGLAARADDCGGAVLVFESVTWRGRNAFRVVKRLAGGGCLAALSVDLGAGNRLEVAAACTDPHGAGLGRGDVKDLTCQLLERITSHLELSGTQNGSFDHRMDSCGMSGRDAFQMVEGNDV